MFLRQHGSDTQVRSLADTTNEVMLSVRRCCFVCICYKPKATLKGWLPSLPQGSLQDFRSGSQFHNSGL